MCFNFLKKQNPYIVFILLWLTFFHFGVVRADEGTVSVTVSYSGISGVSTITADYADIWLLGEDEEYNHGLMRASFVLAVSSFRCKERPLSEKDYSILDFFSQTGFAEPQTDDFHVIPGFETIGSAIANKKIGDTTVIAVSVSGNNYGQEWLSNLTVDDEQRSKGFNDAAEIVMHRLEAYIAAHELNGDLRL